MELKLVLQVVGFMLGLLYLWLEYKADIRLWLVGLVMPLVHGTLYFLSGLYADFAMNVYYLLASLYGYWAWKVLHRSAKSGGRIVRVPLRLWPLLAVAYAGIHAAIWWVLVRFTNSTVPFWDAMTTAMSIVGMWMLSRKYLEQWGVWFFVNAITVGLYFYKEIPLTASLYVIYLAMSVAGYLRWRRVMRCGQA
ncbi:MAG: nicotinamide riboside transporter PnuC [Alistipes sp.]|nr:nicotinamide riboside transporter PnuC [Alistipes sp.]